MPRTTPRLRLAGLAAMAGLATSPTIGGDRPPAPARETPGLLATQVTLAIDRGGERRQFRGTVLTIEGTAVAVLTAAHCLSAADQGGAILLLRDGVSVEGSVVAVARNPAYRPGRDRDRGRQIPGPDNAVARLQFRPAGPDAEAAFRAIRPAPALANTTYPGSAGQAVVVRVIDGHGVEHAFKAGNFSNPRWLEWGPAYKPIPGDSGGGVFVVRAGPDGQAVPHLIGVVVGHDDRGGGASLVARDMRWIADALPR